MVRERASKAEDSDSIFIVNTLYYVVVLVCVGISSWASYYGLAASLGSLAFAGALLIGVVLLASDIGMSIARQKGRSLFKPFIAFCFALFFSTASNFNHFYTQYFSSSISLYNYQDAVKRFERNITSARERLSIDPVIVNTERNKRNLDQQLLQLRQQVLDPNNPGVGPEAEIIKGSIQRQLPDMTRLASPRGRELNVLNRFVVEFEDLARSTFKQTLDNRMRRYNSLKQKMESNLAFYKQRIEQFQNSIGGENPEAVKLIDDMALKTSEYRSIVNEIISEGKKWKPETPASGRDAAVGEIVETFKSVFSPAGDYSVALFSLLLSLFIDLIPLIYALTLVQPVEKRKTVFDF